MLYLVTRRWKGEDSTRVVAKTRGRGRGRGRGVFFFSKFFGFNFCRYSPVMLYSNGWHLSFIYGGN